MRIFEYLLLIASFLIQVVREDFWQVTVYPYLSLIILFQIRWFFLVRKRQIRIFNILIPIVFLLCFYWSGNFDPFMLFLVFRNFYQSESFFYANLQSIFSLFLFFTFHWINLGRIGMRDFLLSVIFLAINLFITREDARIEKLREQIYEKTIREDQLSEDKENILSQAQVLQEIKTLQERNRISRDIHDSAGHVLSTLIIQLEAIAKLSEEKMPELSQMTMALRDYTKEGLEDVRRVIHEMKPGHYDRISFLEKLSSMCQSFQRNTGISVLFHYNQSEFDLTEEQQEAIYRSVQEFLGNTAKHSGADEVRVQIHFTSSRMILDLKDNGKGVEEIQASMGLTGMRERIELAGGRVDHFSSPNKGFHTYIVIERKR